MKRAAKLALIITVLVGLLAFLLPLIPSSYPTSQYHLVCPSPSSMCVALQEPNVYGSITYDAFGYGGVVMPSHSYLLITTQTQPPVRYETE
jgi:hypothetical protein